MAALFEQKQVTEVASRSTANAGDYAGATTQVLSTGTATPGSYIEEVTVTIRGTSTKGQIRFFLKCSTGPKKSFQFAINIPAWVATPGDTVPWSSGPIRGYWPLPDATWTLEFNMETADAVDVTGKGKSYV